LLALLGDDITRLVLSRGYILAAFNRTEIVPDHNEYGRTTGLYAAFPKLEFGALSAWAWGYHRAVDFLDILPEVDGDRIAISGHSRGGKTVLLAGATDERIALTNPNDSGCGGAGCYRIQGQGSETLSDILHRFAYWFNPPFRIILDARTSFLRPALPKPLCRACC
jgi:dienelactone hydrolase